MIDLDKPEEYSKIDQTGLLKDIQELPLQCEQAFEEIKRVVLPSYYVKINKIVILGVGGSAIGGDFVRSIIEKESKIPVFIVRDYHLPGFVDKDSLVIGVSYSGNTEETLTAFGQAISKRAKLVAITSDGKLAKTALSYKIPLYQFDYKTQPRQALGFLFASILGILNKIGHIDIKEDEFKETILLLKALNSKIKPEIEAAKNQAKKLAKELYNKIVVVVAANYLKPVALRFKTQLNENSKQMAFQQELPEACHNFVVGLKAPTNLSESVFILFLSSKFDYPRNRIRQNILLEILDKNKIPSQQLTVEPAPSILSEMLSFTTMLDHTSFYLAILNQIDPQPVSNIDYLKKRLEEAPWQK